METGDLYSQRAAYGIIGLGQGDLSSLVQVDKGNKNEHFLSNVNFMPLYYVPTYFILLPFLNKYCITLIFFIQIKKMIEIYLSCLYL